MGFDYENAKMDILDNGGDPDYLDMNHPDERDSYLKNMGLNPKDYSSASGFSSGQKGEGLFSGIFDGGSDETCFLTTACIRAKDLSDDCDELQTLRYFRDGWLKKQAEGPALTEEYYTIAPGIVQAINRSEDASAVWNRLYEELVLPCVWLIKVGKMEDALFLYKTWTIKLKEQYIPQN